VYEIIQSLTEGLRLGERDLTRPILFEVFGRMEEE
jgi:hypothetical protein